MKIQVKTWIASIRWQRAAVPFAISLYTVTSSAYQGGVHSETLLHTSSAWNGATYQAYPKGTPELSVLRIKIGPHTSMKWHTHPVPNAGYVVSGAITAEEPGSGVKKSFRAGDAIPETVNTVHRGRTGDEGVELLVFYAGVKGMPLSEPLAAGQPGKR